MKDVSGGLRVYWSVILHTSYSSFAMVGRVLAVVVVVSAVQVHLAG